MFTKLSLQNIVLKYKYLTQFFCLNQVYVSVSSILNGAWKYAVYELTWSMNQEHDSDVIKLKLSTRLFGVVVAWLSLPDDIFFKRDISLVSLITP